MILCRDRSGYTNSHGFYYRHNYVSHQSEKFILLRYRHCRCARADAGLWHLSTQWRFPLSCWFYPGGQWTGQGMWILWESGAAHFSDRLIYRVRRCLPPNKIMFSQPRFVTLHTYNAGICSRLPFKAKCACQQASVGKKIFCGLGCEIRFGWRFGQGLFSKRKALRQYASDTEIDSLCVQSWFSLLSLFVTTRGMRLTIGQHTQHALVYSHKPQ